MTVILKVQYRDDRLYYNVETYLTAIDIADFGYIGAAVRATGFFRDEIEEVRDSFNEVVAKKVPIGYIRKFRDITYSNGIK